VSSRTLFNSRPVAQQDLFVGAGSMISSLLRVAVILSIAGVWIGRRFSGLYLGVVEDQLVRRDSAR
jgi:hypothetical protein